MGYHPRMLLWGVPTRAPFGQMDQMAQPQDPCQAIRAPTLMTSRGLGRHPGVPAPQRRRTSQKWYFWGLWHLDHLGGSDLVCQDVVTSGQIWWHPRIPLVRGTSQEHHLAEWTIWRNHRIPARPSGYPP